MVNLVRWYMFMLHKMMNLVGMQEKRVEIESNTVINIWVHSDKPSKKPKPPLVLLHGFAGDGMMTWQFQVLSSLRRNYSLYVPDLLFFGGSHTSRSDRSPRFQADCLAKGLRKLGLGVHEDNKCIVVGFSYGGFVGFQMAEHHPDLVRSMVVIGSSVAMVQSLSHKSLQKVGFSSWSQLLLPTTTKDVKFLLHAGSYSFPWFPTFIFNHFLQVMFSNRKERAELLEALVVKDDVIKYQFSQEIHLLWGDEDKIMNIEVAKSLKEKLGGKTKLVTIKKAGHLAMAERPCVFNKRLNEILAFFAADQHTN